MNNEEFSRILAQQIHACEGVLVDKAREYADDSDRLHNFKVAAALEDVTMRQALAGMMAKHTVSIYDMCGSQYDSTQEAWDEKITDHINYLILLRCIVQEESQDSDPTLFDS